MASKKKLTPFARLLIFLVILVPLAYGGAAYIRGEDPVANVKAMMNGDQPATAASNTSSSSATLDKQEVIERLKKENRELKARIQKLEAELESNSSSSEGRQKWGQ
ncbi:MAG: hypothetical protein AAFY48_13285 [Bacteroidota bacterium]